MTATDTAAAARLDWLDWRRDGIGASDIAGILGISPWSSPWSVWADKVGLLPSDDQLDDDDPREFGRRAEAMVGPWFADRTGLHVTGEQLWCKHREQPWMRATPDGVVVEGPGSSLDDALGGLEIKTDYGRPYVDGVVPEHYQAQGQWQMAVTGWERVWFAVLHGRRFRTYVLDRDQGDIDYMVERAEEFWRSHVLPADPPEADDHDATARAIAALYPRETPGVSAALDHLDGVLDAWREGKELAKTAKRLETGAANAIRAALGDAEEGTIAGRRVVTLRAQTRTTTCKACGHAETSNEFRVLRPAAITKKGGRAQ